MIGWVIEHMSPGLVLARCPRMVGSFELLCNIKMLIEGIHIVMNVSIFSEITLTMYYGLWRH